jgi:hypothetical protein
MPSTTHRFRPVLLQLSFHDGRILTVKSCEWSCVEVYLGRQLFRAEEQPFRHVQLPRAIQPNDQHHHGLDEECILRQIWVVNLLERFLEEDVSCWGAW